MHGIAYGDPSDPATAPWIAAKQVAWVCQAAGVERALVEGSVGGIQDPDQPGAPLGPWSVVITDDYMLFFRPPDDQPFVSDRKQISRLRDPFCSDLRKALLNAARNEPKFVSVHDHGVYLCSSFGRFETTAEIKAFAAAGAHLVGHTLGHEAPLMRKLGIHFAALNIVSNYAEGNRAWTAEGNNSMAEFYQECPQYVGRVIVNALKQIIAQGPGPCTCDDYTLTGLDNLPVHGA